MTVIDKCFDDLLEWYDVNGGLSNKEGRVDLQWVDAWAARCGVSRMKLYDEIAVRLARKFDSSDLGYELCDAVINDVFWIAISENDASSIFMDAFEAFDAGEFHRTPDKSDDPIADHTIPLVKELLKQITTD